MKPLDGLLISVLMVLLLAACGTDTTSNNTGTEAEAENETNDAEQSNHDDEQDAGKTTESEKPDSYETETRTYEDDGDSITVTYPVFSYPELDSVLNDMIDEKFAEYQDRLKEGQAFIEDDEFNPALEFTYDFEEPVITDHFVSIPFHEYTYEGGAHGMTLMRPFNFDLNHNRVLELTDVLEGYNTDLETLANVINSKLLSGDIPNAGDHWTGRDEGLEVTTDHFKYFSLTEDSIIIYFQPYELASFAEGIIDVEIGWDDLTSEDDLWNDI